MDWLSEKALRILELVVSGVVGAATMTIALVRRVDRIEAIQKEHDGAIDQVHKELDAHVIAMGKQVMEIERFMEGSRTRDVMQDLRHAENQDMLKEIRTDIKALEKLVLGLFGRRSQDKDA